MLGPGVPGADGQSPSRGRVRVLVPQPGTRISLGLMENCLCDGESIVVKVLGGEARIIFFAPKEEEG